MTFSNKVYDVLKFLALVVLPAAVTLYVILAGVWHWSDTEAVVASITGVDTFLGSLLKLSTPPSHGTLTLEDNEDGTALRFKDLDEKAVTTQNQVTLNIEHPVL